MRSWHDPATCVESGVQFLEELTRLAIPHEFFPPIPSPDYGEYGYEEHIEGLIETYRMSLDAAYAEGGQDAVNLVVAFESVSLHDILVAELERRGVGWLSDEVNRCREVGADIEDLIRIVARIWPCMSEEGCPVELPSIRHELAQLRYELERPEGR